jgi:hypothetical protein
VYTPGHPKMQVDSRFDSLNLLSPLSLQGSPDIGIGPHQAGIAGMSAQKAHDQQRTEQASVVPALPATGLAYPPPQQPWGNTPQQAQGFPSSTVRFSAEIQPSTRPSQLQATSFNQLIPASTVPNVPAASQAGLQPTINHGITTLAVSSTADHSTFYQPMHCRSADRPPTQHEAHALLLKGFSPNYRGDPDLARNQSAAIPAEANCSLFIVGLAPDLTPHELLSGIRNIGRVYATHINPPVPERGHVFSAAKLVFFERAGAGEFLLSLPSLPPSQLSATTLSPFPNTN